MKINLSSLVRNTPALVALVVAISYSALAAPPLNDNWSSAMTLQLSPTATNGLNWDATVQPCEPLHQIPDQLSLTPKASVWYKWKVPATGSYTVRTVSANFDVVLSAYTLGGGTCNGSPAILPIRRTEGRAYNANLLVPSEGGRISFFAEELETIYISVDSATPTTGFFSLVVEKTKYRYEANLDPLDGAADLVVNDGNANWWMSRHNGFPGPTSSSVQAFGQANDRRFVADFNGDAVSDLAIVRNDNGQAVWWIADKYGSLIKVVQFGLATDRPIVGDWDGDGMADIAVTRPDGAGRKIWHILRSSGQYQAIHYGLGEDDEMVGDYDGDGKTDLVVMRRQPNFERTYTWYIHLSLSGADISHDFGKWFSDNPTPADFDGDGKTDIAVFRSETGVWYSLDSSSQVPLGQRPTRVVQFGIPGDRPQSADYDGDRKTDYAVYRGGEWWILHSRTGQIKTYHFGVISHIPMTDGGIMNAFFY